MTRPTGLLRLFALLVLVASLAGCKTVGRLFDKDAEKPTETLPVEAMYAEGKSALQAGNFNRSALYYQRLVARFPYGAYSEQAQLDAWLAADPAHGRALADMQLIWADLDLLPRPVLPAAAVLTSRPKRRWRPGRALAAAVVLARLLVTALATGSSTVAACGASGSGAVGAPVAGAFSARWL